MTNLNYVVETSVSDYKWFNRYVELTQMPATEYLRRIARNCCIHGVRRFSKADARRIDAVMAYYGESVKEIFNSNGFMNIVLETGVVLKIR